MSIKDTVDNGSFAHADEKYWDKATNTTFQPKADIPVTFILDDGLEIRAAGFKIVRHDGAIEYHACVSTQAGCKFGCKMCASGRNGFKRNLTVEEIVGQVDHIAERFGVEVLDHVVFMGIGEPLDNREHFIDSLRALNTKGYERKLSFATVGNPKRICDFAEITDVPIKMLWLSIHAPNDEKRKEILPIASTFSIRSVLDAGIYFAQKSYSKVYVNYLLYKEFNDSFEDAGQLATLLKGTDKYLTVQLTEPNDTDFSTYAYGKREDIERFRRYLIQHGVTNRIIRFVAAGRNVRSGCGEFVFTG